MLNQNFNQKSMPMVGPRQQGMPVTSARIMAAMAMRNNQAADQVLSPSSPLVQAIARKKKKKY